MILSTLLVNTKFLNMARWWPGVIERDKTFDVQEASDHGYLKAWIWLVAADSRDTDWGQEVSNPHRESGGRILDFPADRGHPD